ncbi:TRAP transporter small permease [Marinobacterium aestuariivivens]|uniref:TRAP transporter small permease protein n=1 Tax=Marinobacterium aestuariivivens TaxID=1698799 RepID=A0ABW1ZTX3_9GAMM
MDTVNSETLIRWFDRLVNRPLRVVAMVVMFLMMATTLVDVVGRYLFDAPLKGAFELTELMLAAVIFLGLPLITAENGHIAVDLLDSLMPARLQRWLIGLANVLAFGVFAWVLWDKAFKVLRYGDTTAVLQIPYAWLCFLMAATTTLSTLALLLMLFIKGDRLVVRGGH